MSDTKIDDGGPAYPFAGSDGHCYNDQGMSLRDHFAGLTLNGGLSQKNFCDDMTFEQRAEWCYAQADAMIAARRKA